MADARLLVVGVAARVIAMVADVLGVEAVDEAKRAVVQRQPQNAEVIGVHHPVAEAYGLPSSNHLGGALDDAA